MSFNLVESIKDLLPRDLRDHAAGLLGENPANIQQAMNGAIPSVLTGMLHKAGTGDVGSVLNQTVDAAKNGIPENLGALPANQEGLAAPGVAILKNLFGDQVSGLTNALASFSGVSSQSAGSLLHVIAPAAMAVVGKQVIDSNLNAAGLVSFLNSQKDHILNAIPTGLNLSGLLGVAGLSEIAGKLSNNSAEFAGKSARSADSITEVTTAAATGGGSQSRWLLPLLVIVVLIGIIWYFMNRHSPGMEVPSMTDTVAVENSSMASPPAGPQQIQIKLPDGAELNAEKGGIEDQLVKFLNDPDSKPGKDVWFDFDRLGFNAGSSDISSESIDQIENVGAILKAYPKVKVKVGGYTDRTGDAAGNKKLSADRAESVAAALKGAGAKASQVTGAEGYGSTFAKAPADAPDAEKKKDRHISISVRAK